MFVKVCFLVVLAAVAMSAPPECFTPCAAEQWAQFKVKHNKHYETPEEDQRRFEIFKDNIKVIEKHNKKYDAGEVSYQQGINAFTDLTHEEFSKTHLMHLPIPKN